jgi:meso-butanediol dehydrogenase/(S,S)-butanediol dehydrogenase/diacetyl reductase
MSIIDTFRLDNRVALITGAGSGIGKGIAKVYSEAGAKLFIAGRREANLKAVQSEIEEAGGTCEYVTGDVSSEEGCRSIVEACIKAYGSLDILVNNAGTGGSGAEDLEGKFDTDDYYHVMKTDFDAVFFMTKYAYPHAAKGGKGAIINLSSIASIVSFGRPNYSSAKGAVKSLTMDLGNTLSKVSVRVNSILPGLIRSEMTDWMFQNGDEQSTIDAFGIPLNRIGLPEDIAYAALFLASDASSFITGVSLVVDGGTTTLA